MGPDKIAPLAVYLASDLSKDVTGQIFASRMNEIFLFSQNRPIRSAGGGGRAAAEAGLRSPSRGRRTASGLHFADLFVNC